MFEKIFNVLSNSNYGIDGWSGEAHKFGETPFAIAFGNVHWYGVFWAIGIFTAVIIAILKLRFFHKISYEPFFYFVFPAILIIILGSRAWSFIIGDTNIGTPFFDFQSGNGISGLAIHGGVIFCGIFGIVWFSLFLRKPKYFAKVCEDGKIFFRRVSIWIFADTIFPTILIGQAIGRWGNFFNHEIYGGIVGTPIPNVYNPIVYDPGNSYSWLKILMPGVYEHMFIIDNGIVGFRVPLFLIESFFNVVFFIFLYSIVEQFKGYRSGILTGSYFLFYGTLRLILEQLRDERFGFLTSIITSILFLIIGLLIILFTWLLAPKLRKHKMWYMICIYITYWFRKIYYFFVPNNAQKKITFNLNKNNLGYNKKKEFNRSIIDMLYYHDELYWGPFIIWIHNLFFRKNKDKKIFLKSKVEYLSSDIVKDEIKKIKSSKDDVNNI